MAKLTGAEVYPFYFGAKPEILRLASELRHNLTLSEKLLWEHLRNRKLSGFRFRRQHPVNEFIVDFFYPDALLAIEVDGNVHEDVVQHQRDHERTIILNRFNIKVLRFTNNEVQNDTDLVLSKIKEKLSEIKNK